MFDRSFNGASFDVHDGPVRCCRAVPRSNDCQSCSTRDKWWEGDGCVDRTEHVQLQPHAKLVAIQTEACVCSWGGASACCSEPCGDLLTELLSPGGRKRLTLRMLDKVSETAAGLSA